MEQIEKPKGLPENAHRELKPGENYTPIMSPDIKVPEATPYSVMMGVLMAIIFSAAAAYLGLKVGQVFEAAIPIAIMEQNHIGRIGFQFQPTNILNLIAQVGKFLLLSIIICFGH